MVDASIIPTVPRTNTNLATIALAEHFAPLAKALAANETQIVAEFKTVQGKPVDIGGYYKLDDEKVSAVMRPSATFNAALNSFVGA